jgi:glycopeptide antibiotics resistance protein
VYVQLRTAVPFLVIGYILQFLCKPNAYFTLKGFVFSFLVVLIAEGGQFLLPYRHPDVMDIVFGVLGTLLGMFFYYQTFKLRHLIMAKK